MTEPRREPREPLAIVGIGCRFPGAANLQAFWSLLVEGRDAVGDIPEDRFGIARLFAAGAVRPGHISSRRGGFLEGFEAFDAEFFGIAPREAVYVDPQQRVLLEVTWEALEDAGIPARTLIGSPTGVFIGCWLSDFEARLCRRPELLDVLSVTGSGRYSISGRISFALGLEGPSLTVDTACSSALTAVHLASQSIWAGETDIALAGAANIILEPHISIAYSQAGMLSSDGACKFGDASANGYVRSEGAGVVVLKRLSAARADGDPIYAVIRGSALNNNGSSGQFLVRPAQHGHERMLRDAYRHAGVAPADVSYVEAHGTGTVAGNPIELKALGAVLGEGRDPARPCLVGSVKTNIGHAEAAAGMAGLIKTALGLKHQFIPASLHFEHPSEAIPWSDLPIAIVRQGRPWPAQEDAPIAGVSAFGITGTNAHVVLQAATSAPRQTTPPDADRPRLLLLSGRSSAARDAAIDAYRRLLEEPSAESTLNDLCAWAALRRDHHPYRVAVVASDRAGLIRGLSLAAAGEPDPLIARGDLGVYRQPPVAFVFPGQGGQWLGMGRELAASEPIFRAALAACDETIRAEAGWSMLAELNATPETSRLARIDVVQPTIFAVQVALAALWRSWGIAPAAVIGHSMGEVTAAVVAGILTIEDGARVICRRSTLMRRLSGSGAMAVIGLSYERTAEALQGREHQLSIAASNSAQSTVVSGDVHALDVLCSELQLLDVFCRHVKVDVASHSPQMDAIAADLMTALHDIRPCAGDIPMYSTVAGQKVDGRGCDAAYWVSNLRRPVLFAPMIQAMLADGIRALLEISPHPVLESAMSEAARSAAEPTAVTASTRRDQSEREAMLAAVASLFTIGCDPDWRALYQLGRPVRLPSYAWQRERFWPEDRLAAEPVRVDQPIESSLDPGRFLWPVRRVTLSSDHVDLVQAAAMAAGALTERLCGLSSVVVIDDGLQGGAADIQCSARLTGDSEWALQIFRRRHDIWSRALEATVRPIAARAGDTVEAPAGGESFEAGPFERGSTRDVLNVMLAEAATWLGGPCRIAGITSLTMREETAVRARCVFRLVPTGVDASAEICDADGAVVGRLNGASLQLQSPQEVAARSLYELEWVPTVESPRRLRPAAGAVLIVSESSHFGLALEDRLRDAGESVVRASVGQPGVDAAGNESVIWLTGPEDLEGFVARWMAGGGAAVTRVVFIASHAVASNGAAVAPTACSGSTRRLDAIFRWLERRQTSERLEVIVVTRDVWALSDDRPIAGLGQSPLWGFVRSAATAHPGLICTTIDVPGSPSSADLDRLVECCAANQASERVVRDGRLLAPRFRSPSSSEPSMPALRLRPDATYLVSGGSGGVGVEIARWLVSRGACHLALVSRRPVSPHLVSMLTAGRTDVLVEGFTGDLGVAEDVRRVILAVGESMPPLAGIVHAAAVTRGDLDVVLAAKADGAWHLHEATRNLPLDWFVLCSSIAASVAHPGESAYAAANTYLDALACYRRSLGLPALSVEWGGWAGTGLATEAGVLRLIKSWRRQGIAAITPAVATAALERALAGTSGCVLVSPVNWAAFRESRLGDDARGLFAALIADGRITIAAGDPVTDLRERLRTATGSERRDFVRRGIREQLATVLRSDASRIDMDRPLGTVGLDSLLTVEFAKRVASTFAVRLSATAVFNFPTLNALEREITAQLAAAAPAQSLPPSSTPPPAAQDRPEASVADMTEEDAILALMSQRGADA